MMRVRLTRQMPEIRKSQSKIINNSTTGKNSCASLNEIYQKEHPFIAATK